MGIKEYLMSLLCVAVAAAITQGMLKGNAQREQLCFLCAVCVLAALVVPSSRLIFSLGSAEDMVDKILPESDSENEGYGKIYISHLLDGGAEEVERYIVSELSEKLLESKENIGARVTLSADGKGAEVRSVKVFLYPSAYDAEPEKIKKLVSMLFQNQEQLLNQLSLSD